MSDVSPTRAVGDFPLRGKIVLVTGGGSGITLSFVRLAIEREARVIVGDLRLTKEAEDFKATAKGLVFQACDVTIWADLQALVETSKREFGEVPDVYVPGAGVFEPDWSSFWGDEESDGYGQADINISHPIKLTRIAIRALLGAGKKGVVLHTASVAGIHGFYASPLYCATKHAIVGFVKALTDADRLEGVKVVAVAPGFVKTPLVTDRPALMYQFSISDESTIAPEEVASWMAALVEEGQYGGGTVMEITKAGVRRIPAWNIDPPVMVKAAAQLPPPYIERMLAPIAQKLAGEKKKVFIVTGGASGVGFELTKLIYQKNATVYIAGRGADNARKAIDESKAKFPQSEGRLDFLKLDLADLTGIKASAAEFLSKEDRLDVLWNNAGVMVPPKGSKTVQGHELQLGTNCLAPFLFTQELLPLLKKTAETAPAGSVRVIWTGSLMVDLMSPKGGVNVDDLTYKKDVSQEIKYAASKAGNALLASEMAKRVGKDGIVSVVSRSGPATRSILTSLEALNPGNLKSPLQRHVPAYQMLLMNPILHDPIYGGYTELFAGLSPEVTLAQNGGYIIPWGRFQDLAKVRPDIGGSLKSAADGGTGAAERFWAWCEEESRAFR
ncbi:MAG: hypothetical protein M1832_001033 [Thelocarpon impressellum]|nr:MAG: hypothetical protein M1832_001033 [Thelocarpon impressellum]